MDNETRRFRNYYELSEDGRFVLMNIIDMNSRKECPNCYNLFVKSINMFAVSNSKEAINFFLKCPACGCRIKIHVN